MEARTRAVLQVHVECQAIGLAVGLHVQRGITGGHEKGVQEATIPTAATSGWAPHCHAGHVPTHLPSMHPLPGSHCNPDSRQENGGSRKLSSWPKGCCPNVAQVNPLPYLQEQAPGPGIFSSITVSSGSTPRHCSGAGDTVRKRTRANTKSKTPTRSRRICKEASSCMCICVCLYNALIHIM